MSTDRPSQWPAYWAVFGAFVLGMFALPVAEHGWWWAAAMGVALSQAARYVVRRYTR